jgi:hypothetical protein
MNAKVLPVIIGHKPPLFSFWGKFKQVSYQDKGDQFLTLPNFLIYPGVDDREIGEYHYLFGLRRYLEESQEKFGVVIVEHYRRLLSSQKMGTPTNLNQSHTFAITPEEAERQDSSIILPKSGSWLIGTPVIIHNGRQLNHFQLSHPLQEYLRILALAIDIGALGGGDVVNLLSSPHMITAPSVGVFPVDRFIKHMRILERLTKAYLDTGAKKYDGFNQRIIAFCLERIHSYLLMTVIEELKFDPNVMGYQLVLTEDGIVRPSGL